MENQGITVNAEQAERLQRARSARCVINPLAFATAMICCALPPLCIALAFNRQNETPPASMIILGIILAILGFFIGAIVGAQIGLICARNICDFADDDINAIRELPVEYDYRGRRSLC